ncbi:MAG: GTPase ObgE [Alphaproteobacteria bacterium]|nr:GTPase ObgE [Alphaproteobacteria bacterium]MCB9792375.1 GTPase ObgE [Alphaproteobacteria bacterium]
MRFIDEVEIRCISGRGGAGCASFRREMYVPRGGPDGGDGGKGGDIVLVASTRRNTLEHLRGQRLYKAQGGQPGKSRNMTGRGGEDFLIEVPVGTMVIDMDTEQQLADLTEDGALVVLCAGGQGGRGNVHFKSATNRTPRRADEGGAPEDRRVRLELKLLADVGLLGFPNAGKSTLISRVSNARPRVADYPFTTLVPNLGVVSKGWEASFVIADIPGLIQGASEGAGLGHQFLRHVERCRFFLHLVSATTFDEDVKDPLARYRAINGELLAFDPELAERPQILVLTKADAVDEEALSTLVARFEAEEGLTPRVISSVTGDGLETLMNECWAQLRDMLDEQDAT